MKSIVMLGVVAVVLFTAAAALSILLNPKQKTTEESKEPTGKRKAKEKADDTEQPGPASKMPGAATLDSKGRTELLEATKRLDEKRILLENREKYLEAVIQDLQVERDAVELIRAKLAEELRMISAQTKELENKFTAVQTEQKKVGQDSVDLARKRVEYAKDEEKNIAKLATMYDKMEPDTAAKVLQEMADRGKMDTAAKILSQMKPDKAAKVLSAILDPTLAGQLMDRMTGIKAVGSTQ